MLKKCIKTIVLYQAINGIVVGLVCLSYAAFMMINVPKNSVQRLYNNDIYFYHFLLWVSISSVLKGFLLLIATPRKDKILFVVYIIWTTIVLFLGKTFVVRAAKQMSSEMKQMSRDNLFLKQYERSYSFYFYIFYPLIFVFAWFFQIVVILYFVILLRHTDPEAKNEDMDLADVKNDVEVVDVVC